MLPLSRVSLVCSGGFVSCRSSGYFRGVVSFAEGIKKECRKRLEFLSKIY